jgi:hypothetical protein
MNFSIKKFLGLATEPPLSDIDTRLFAQLQANRKVALAEIIPDELMLRFMTGILSDRNLKMITQMVSRARFTNGNANLHGAYLEDLIRACLATNHFGRKLIVHYGIDPQSIVDIMLRDIRN